MLVIVVCRLLFVVGGDFCSLLFVGGVGDVVV